MKKYVSKFIKQSIVILIVSVLGVFTGIGIAALITGYTNPILLLIAPISVILNLICNTIPEIIPEIFKRKVKIKNREHHKQSK